MLLRILKCKQFGCARYEGQLDVFDQAVSSIISYMNS
jgi:hypothetical protein